VETERLRHSIRLSTPSRVNERVLSLSLLADRRTIPGIETRTREALIAGYAWTRRHFDQPLAPTRGYSAGIDLSAGFGGQFHEDRIARVLLSGVWIRPLHARWTAVARLQAGQISGAREDSVPEDLLFRTGGDQTVRGYGYGRLGVPRNNAIVGGNVMSVISTELIYRLTPAWGVGLFHDAGDAALSWQEFRWRRGIGMGARWRSPIGALNIDIARGLDQGETRLHFSVGYGF
jgi:translocation and assembly module TamA